MLVFSDQAVSPLLCFSLQPTKGLQLPWRRHSDVRTSDFLLCAASSPFSADGLMCRRETVSGIQQQGGGRRERWRKAEREEAEVKSSGSP